MRTVMKNKVFTRLIEVFIMALEVLTAAYPQAAYAQTDETEAAQEELKKEIKKPKITAIEKKKEKEKEVRYPNKLNAKEPENLKKNVKTFHLIINHDEQGENVMLLTEVS